MGSEDAKNAAAAWILDRAQAQGSTISRELRSAALRVWPQALAYAKRELQGSPLADDESAIWEVWESTLQAAGSASLWVRPPQRSWSQYPVNLR
jgi:hypothetical protein